MNANITVKNISKEDQEPSSPEELTKNYIALTVEEELVNKYEKLYSELYMRAFALRVVFFIGTIALISFTIYISKNFDKWSNIEPVFAAISVLLGLLATAFSTFFQKQKSFITGLDYSDLINSLEDTIVKLKLEQRFQDSVKLRDKVEDFYIELSKLTKAKYETAFRYYSYEFYIYAVISIIIAAFFTLRIF